MSKQKMPQMYRDAHKACFKNWRILKKSKTCGCFYCLRVYAASEVGDWCVERDRRRTALCPYCAVDSVIPDASGWPLDADFLKKMKCWWFETGGVTIKVPDVIRKKLDAIGKKLNYINRVLPGGLFVADSDGKIELLGIIDPNSKSRIFPDLKDGGL
ncbi:MAG: hypothetical protein IKC23_06090 [Fibrobacter sp.]|jgi:hypothetical protein|nr:hypothetical protein [Fibrobacter sp.]MBQ3840437.1 hypothetical protein [Fibrobacter sp.]MBR2075403.1 hypothetical protein [Fibrobacter sp.]MBR2899175.1 hypothetical protein [Fibrobacter sp.]